jgi:hypothetical protein
MQFQPSSLAASIVRAVLIALVFASISLQAASTYYATVAATVTPASATYVTTLTTIDDETIPPQFRYKVQISDCGNCPVGSMHFEAPPLDLPRSAKVLSARFLLGLYYAVDVSSRIEVTPINPERPAAPTTGMWYRGIVHGYLNEVSGITPLSAYDLNTEPGAVFFENRDYTELVRTALATGGQLEPITAEIFVDYGLSGSGLAITAGENSVTVETRTLTLGASGGQIELAVDYELVPEPSTAAFLVIGLLGLLLCRKYTSRAGMRSA